MFKIPKKLFLVVSFLIIVVGLNFLLADGFVSGAELWVLGVSMSYQALYVVFSFVIFIITNMFFATKVDQLNISKEDNSRLFLGLFVVFETLALLLYMPLLVGSFLLPFGLVARLFWSVALVSFVYLCSKKRSLKKLAV